MFRTNNAKVLGVVRAPASAENAGQGISLSSVVLGMGLFSLLAGPALMACPSVFVYYSGQFSTTAGPEADKPDQIAGSETDAAEHILVRIREDGCEIVSRGKAVARSLATIFITEIDAAKPALYILSQDETQTMEQVPDFHAWLDGYQNFIEQLEKDTSQLTQSEKGAADILSILDIAANLIEVGAAAGGIGLWLIKKLIEKRRSQSAHNPLIDAYTQQAEIILKFFEKVPKARIAEISAGTTIRKENLLYFLKSMSFAHEPACFWKPPVVPKKLVKAKSRKV